MNVETPWAVVQQMRADGRRLEEIVEALTSRGLTRDDVELLLQDDADFREWSRTNTTTPVAMAPPKDSSPPVEWGRLLRWGVITLSALAAGVMAAFAHTGRDAGVAALVGLPAAALLIAELKNGVRRVARPLSFVLFFSCAAPALSGFIGGWHSGQVVPAVLLTLSVPLLVGRLVRAEKLKGLADFGDATVFESEAVQFSVTWPTVPCGAGDAVKVSVRAQNCVDVPRSLRIVVRGDAHLNLAPIDHRLELEPGCIVEATVPVRVPSVATERFAFTINLLASGQTNGRRVRLARGAEWVSPSDSLTENLVGLATLATAGLGVFRLGSNGVITVKVDANKPWNATEHAVETKELYRPDAATLEAAATS